MGTKRRAAGPILSFISALTGGLWKPKTTTRPPHHRKKELLFDVSSFLPKARAKKLWDFSLFGTSVRHKTETARMDRYSGFHSRQTLRAALREREWLIVAELEFEVGRPPRAVLRKMARRRAAAEYVKMMRQPEAA